MPIGLTNTGDVNVRMIFVFSRYCMFEFKTALHHWITKKRTRRVIVLMALDRPTDLYANDASDTAVLRHYLRQYSYSTTRQTTGSTNSSTRCHFTE